MMNKTDDYNDYEVRHERIDTLTTVELGISFLHYTSFHGHESTELSVEKIIDCDGNTVMPVWDEQWTEISRGINSKKGKILIHPSACPVRLLYKSVRTISADYDGDGIKDDFPTVITKYYWIWFERG
jgi:hypothetical protein